MKAKGKKNTDKQTALEATLNIKQRTFVLEYLKDMNATQAAIRAGYAKKTAYSQGQRLLKHVDIARVLQVARDERAKETKTDAKWVIEQLEKVHNRCMQIDPVMGKVDGEWKETGLFKFDSTGAIKSLELIGKHHGMFTEKVKHEGEVTINVVKEVIKSDAS